MESKVGNVMYPTPDVAGAIAFYQGVLGLPVKFQDGDRYAALDGGTVTFALAIPDEAGTRSPVASFKVTDIAAACARVREAGGMVSELVDGPHETRAIGTDPAGNEFVLYAPPSPTS